jgi:DNA-binding NarL/FixJ family response regulator
MQDELLYGEVALGAGADGYLMKDTAHANIVQAALAVLDGETWVSPALRARMLDRFLQRKRPADQAAEASLTVREREVLEQLKQGKTTKEIARALGISARTVDLHRATIKRKLGLRTGVELVAYAFNRL